MLCELLSVIANAFDLSGRRRDDVDGAVSRQTSVSTQLTLVIAPPWTSFPKGLPGANIPLDSSPPPGLVLSIQPALCVAQTTRRSAGCAAACPAARAVPRRRLTEAPPERCSCRLAAAARPSPARPPRRRVGCKRGVSRRASSSSAAAAQQRSSVRPQQQREGGRGLCGGGEAEGGGGAAVFQQQQRRRAGERAASARWCSTAASTATRAWRSSATTS